MSLFAEVADAVKFFVDHEPIAQPRMKISGFHRWLPKTADGDPHPVIAYKKVIRLCANAAYRGKPFEGPLKASFLFLLPRPGRLIWKTKPMARLWAPGRPDTDNFCKAVMDALINMLWLDDSQIVDLRAVKMYAAGDEQAGVEIQVEELP